MKPSVKIRKTTGISFNYAIYICVFLACFVPRYISTFKIHIGINISLYTIAVLILWLFTTHKFYLKNKLENYFFLIWAAFIIISVWRAEKIGVWAYYLDWVLTAILFQQILLRHRDENTYEYIIRAFTDALFLHLLIGIYEVTANRYLFEIGNLSRRLYGNVAIGIFHNLNDYATFVVTMIPFVIYRFLKSRKKLEKIYCAFLAVTSLYFAVVSESRGAILTLIIFVCVGAFLFARRNNRNTIITIGFIMVLAIILLANIGGIRTILFDFIGSNTINVSGKSDTARINLIKNGFYFLEETNGFGVGAGNLYKWLQERSIYYIGGLAFIHNWYIEVLVTFGVLFFIIYAVFHAKILYKLGSRKYGTNNLKTAVFLSFVCFSIVSISSSSNVYSEWVWMYFIVVALFSYSLNTPGKSRLPVI